MGHIVRNVYVKNIFALTDPSVVTVESAFNAKNRNQEGYNNSGVSIIQIRKGGITLIRTYIFCLDVAKKLGEISLVARPIVKS
jgi:ketosteroid isomerase-like protein